ncbi:DUF4397 domain-containing protein [Mucilaginibacter rubeus]|uniref:DUF4397 domain-containing protein n=1 Tax=Mucilaginibacter rubeus TaxID=2027860 RepID=A0AAE6MJI1_9SPHI|nr:MULTISPECIES: DUF4397 domain-containing protein [Mucilaginibacter]QEM05718.1 DUF4397 domain-containing protein [Mucilaginibacter rubeus]QEM18306.1 DUF4397 domain-containing protein [Mucilaginibacter gossypii]QTE36751.1 DUF4397 domain-containing protein [Mucilaginibacter gossypii]QTE45161.1 DUF4397 domain-containing protein [Mucilaginibacter rubeus]QTE51757.1 DUF4397 domain-containing protein [Mucilaginibacter rubeus]
MNIKVKVLLLIAAAGCFASCKKNNDKPDVVDSSTSSLNVINATFNNVNVYLNGTRVNNTTTFYPGGTLGYITVKAGTQNYSVKLDGPNNPNPLFSLPLTLSKDSVYSFYIAGNSTDQVFKTTDIIAADTNKVPSAKIRFVNASPDAGNISVHFEGTTAALDTEKVKDLAFKGTSTFYLVTPGEHNMALHSAAFSGTIVRDTVQLVGGKVYTYYGFGNKSTGLATGLFINQ